MNPLKVLFFGSTSDSVIVAKKLQGLRLTDYDLRVVAAVTQPPRPVGRKQFLTPTPVEAWARERNIAVLSFPNLPKRPYLFADEEAVIAALAPARSDLVISASYGQKIPMAIINKARFGGLNIHPSLLPRWRGADPVPWAILAGDTQTGVTIVTLEEKFDQGKIIAQKKVPITGKDFADPLRTRLFTLGANLFVESLPDYLSGKNKGIPQPLPLPLSHSLPPPLSPSPYARRLTRQDGFEKWEVIKEATETGKDADRLDRKFRAFSPWPGLWTKVNISAQEKRLKILSCRLSPSLTISRSPHLPHLVLDTIQLEGKNPASFKQVKDAYQL